MIDKMESQITDSARIRVAGSPSTLSDRFKMKGDGESSICSWAFVAEPDRNSFHVCLFEICFNNLLSL